MVSKSKSSSTSICLLTLCFTTPSQAMLVSLGSTTIVDNGAGDTNMAIGVIDFNLMGLSGTSGTYNASGTVTEVTSGSTTVTNGINITLTNLDIEATSGAASDTIVFQSTSGPLISLPSPGSVSLDGNWTSGASNAPSLISGSNIALSGYLFGDWQWGAIVGAASEFPVGFSGTGGVTSDSGSVFGPVAGGSLIIPAANTVPFFGQPLYQADFTSIVGKLDFNLNNNGDGLWLPGSANVYMGETSAVPVPAAVWLFGSGLMGLIGFARRKTVKRCRRD